MWNYAFSRRFGRYSFDEISKFYLKLLSNIKKSLKISSYFVAFSEYVNFTGFYGRFVFDKKVLYFPIMVFWPGNQARKSVWHLRDWMCRVVGLLE